jgi:O-antigen/teichoic acid export membrane protein
MNIILLSKNLSWNSVAVLVIFLISFFGGIYIARILGPNTLGEFIYIVAVVEVMAIVNDFTFGTILIQRQEDDSIELAGNILLLNLLIGFIFLLIVYIYSNLIEHNENQVWLYLLAVFKFISIVCSIFSAIVYKKLLFSYEAKTNIILHTIAFLTAYFIIEYETSILPLVIQYGIINLNNLIMIFFVNKSDIKLSFKLKNIKLLFRHGKHIFVTASVNRLKIHLDKIMINILFSNIFIAFYTKGKQLVEVGPNLLISIVKNILFSYLSIIQSNKYKQKNVINLTTFFLMRIFAFVYIIIFLYSHEVILILLGEKWVDASYIIKMLSILIIINPFISIGKVVFTSNGEYKLMSKFSLFELFSSIGFSLMGFFIAGLDGLLIGINISTIMLILIMKYLIKLKMGIDYLNDIKFYIFIILLLLYSMHIKEILLFENQFFSFSLILISTFVGILLYSLIFDKYKILKILTLKRI